MKRWLLISLGFLLLSSLLAVREWLIVKEVKALQAELLHSLSQNVESAESFDRLKQISESFFIYDRYLEPVFNSGQRLLNPFIRHKTLTLWESHIHRELENKSYLRMLQLRESLERQIADIRDRDNPSKERLKKVMKLSAQFDSESDRLQILQSEMEAIEKALKETDEKLFAEIRELGLQNLRNLRAKIRGMNQKEFIEYISSMEFVKNFQEPVIHKMMEVSLPELRKKLWSEYSKAQVRVLSRRSRVLAKAEPPIEQIVQQPVQSLAELLRREYERESVKTEKTPTPSNPAQ